MSASPLDLEPSDECVEYIDTDTVPHAPLSGGDDGGGSGNGNEMPTTSGIEDVILGEDANQYDISLNDYFDDPTGATLTYQIVGNTYDPLFKSLEISGSVLTIDLAPDKSGEAFITIRATDPSGGFVDDQFRVTVIDVNDRPTTTGLFNIVVDEDSSATVIDLFAAFDDVEDADEELTFTITQNTNPDLFSSIVIDPVAGTLTFNYAPNAFGSSLITLRATDSEGLYVEMASSGRFFPIYDLLMGDEGEDKPANLDLRGLQLIGAGFLFDRGPDGSIDFTKVNYERLAWWLEHVARNDQPLTLDIENEEFWGNTPEGRDRFAEILQFISDMRPDIPQLGIYSVMPERDWFGPVHFLRAQEDLLRGLTTFYSNNAPQFFEEYNTWLLENSWFRTEELSPDVGGGVLADYVQAIYPSLYTSYRDGYNSAQGNLIQLITLNPVTDRFHIADTVVVNGMRIRPHQAEGSTLPGNLNLGVDYYVVNADGHSFQLSETLDGPAMDFATAGEGPIYGELKDSRNFMWHDPDVVYWRTYAEYNIAEARKYGHETIAWLSPSFRALSQDYLDKNFFRLQLDTMYELGDGIVLYNPRSGQAGREENHAWWGALTEFIDYLNSPTQFLITVNSINDAPTTQGIPDFNVPQGTSLVQVELFPLFDDVEDFDAQLQFNVVSISVNELFQNVFIDSATGQLNLQFSGLSGSSLVTIEAVDRGGLSVQSTFLVSVDAGDPTILAEDDFFNVLEDGTLDILGAGVLENDYTSSGNDLIAQLILGPRYAESFWLNPDGTFHYAPTADFFGTDTFLYVALDGNNVSDVAMVTLTVQPVNDAPETNGLADITLPPGTPSWVVDLWEAFDDVDDPDPLLTFEVIANSNPALFSSLVIDPSTGRLILRPDDAQSGATTLVIRATDRAGLSVDASLNVTLLPDTIGPPESNDDTFGVDEDRPLAVDGPGVLANDLGYGPLTAVLISGPQHAADFRLNPDGSFSYLARRDYFGVDVFTYVAVDRGVPSAIATVTINVTPVNDAPTTSGLSDIVVESGTPAVSIDLWEAFDDVEDADSELTYQLVNAGDNPLLQGYIDPETGQLNLTFTDGTWGTTAVTVRATDSGGKSVSTAFQVTVNPRNEPPTASDFTFDTLEDAPLAVDEPGLLSGAYDPEDDPLSVRLVSGPQNAADFRLNADGTFHYRPGRDFNGTDSFTFYVTDGINDSNWATVTLSVRPVNDRPVGESEVFATRSGMLDVEADRGPLLNERDVDSDQLTAVLLARPQFATDFEMAADGSFVYRSLDNFVGIDAFTYAVFDGIDVSAPLTAFIIVTGGLDTGLPDGLTDLDPDSLLGVGWFFPTREAQIWHGVATEPGLFNGSQWVLDRSFPQWGDEPQDEQGAAARSRLDALLYDQSPPTRSRYSYDSRGVYRPTPDQLAYVLTLPFIESHYDEWFDTVLEDPTFLERYDLAEIDLSLIARREEPVEEFESEAELSEDTTAETPRPAVDDKPEPELPVNTTAENRREVAQPAS